MPGKGAQCDHPWMDSNDLLHDLRTLLFPQPRFSDRAAFELPAAASSLAQYLAILAISILISMDPISKML
jgi:hypothetical protein